MTRVVVDTNVFVSSFFGGNPREVIDLWKTGRVTLCLSAPIVEEYMAVLKKARADGRTGTRRIAPAFPKGISQPVHRGNARPSNRPFRP